MGLRARLILLIALIALPLVGLALYLAAARGANEAADARQRALVLARAVVDEHQDVIERARHLTVAMAEIWRRGDPRGRECARMFDTLLREYGSYTVLGIADADGAIVCSAPAARPATSLRDRPIFQRGRETRAFLVGEYAIGRVSGRPSLGFAAPLTGPAGEFAGLVFGALAVPELHKLAVLTSLPASSTVTVVDRRGMILLRRPEAGPWAGRDVSSTTLVAAMRARTAETGDLADIDGRRRYFGFAALGGGDAFVAVGLDRDEVLAASRRGLFQVGGGARQRCCSWPSRPRWRGPPASCSGR